MLRRALVLAAACLIGLPAAGQAQRNFPQNALRGTIVFGDASQILLNGDPARLAPGSRIRDAANMAVVSGAVIGGKYLVHYTVDLYGLVKEVWILTPDEALKKPWPSTAEDAAAWTFDPVGQTWTKP